jgi:hypothetical protein
MRFTRILQLMAPPEEQLQNLNQWKGTTAKHKQILGCVCASAIEFLGPRSPWHWERCALCDWCFISVSRAESSGAWRHCAPWPRVNRDLGTSSTVASPSRRGFFSVSLAPRAEQLENSHYSRRTFFLVSWFFFATRCAHAVPNYCALFVGSKMGSALKYMRGDSSTFQAQDMTISHKRAVCAFYPLKFVCRPRAPVTQYVNWWAQLRFCCVSFFSSARKAFTRDAPHNWSKVFRALGFFILFFVACLA